jgi:Mn2+/Fe2+ NRAMP family transporter
LHVTVCVIQGINAGIGAVTGKGLAQNLRRHYPPWVVRSAVSLLLAANFINLGADLGAMGAALRLLIDGPPVLYAAVFGFVCAYLEIVVSYQRYVSVLKWLTLSLFSYVAVVLAVKVPGGFAFAVFATGIIGTGLLAVPVLAGSAAYAVAEMMRWPEGLDRRRSARPQDIVLVANRSLMRIFETKHLSRLIECEEFAVTAPVGDRV